MMYNWAADGISVSEIIERLYTMGIKSPQGRDRWSHTSVVYILTNEKYCGDALMQKTFVADLFSHKTKKNTGQETQYLATNKFEAIVSKEQWLYVQRLLGTSSLHDIIDVKNTIDIGPWTGMRTVLWDKKHG